MQALKDVGFEYGFGLLEAYAVTAAMPHDGDYPDYERFKDGGYETLDPYVEGISDLFMTEARLALELLEARRHYRNTVYDLTVRLKLTEAQNLRLRKGEIVIPGVAVRRCSVQCWSKGECDGTCEQEDRRDDRRPDEAGRDEGGNSRVRKEA